jgi:hypothetical protein
MSCFLRRHHSPPAWREPEGASYSFVLTTRERGRRLTET